MVKGIRIRDYESGDSREIVRLHRESPDSFEEEITESFIESIAFRIDYRIFVCEKEREFIGFCGVLYHISCGRAEIGPIVVDRGNRRMGVGRSLVEYVMEYLREQGIRRVTAKVKASNKVGRCFFESLGFVGEGFFEKYTKKGEDVVQYVRFL